MDATDRSRLQRQAGQQRVDDAHVTQVHGLLLEPGGGQTGLRQLDHFQVGFQPGVAVDLGAELQRLAGAEGPVDAGVQDWSAIAEPGQALAVQQMRVDARDLRRRVGAQAQAAARQLVNQLEGLQVECLAGAGEQGIQVLDHRRDDELVAVGARGIEQRPAQVFDMPGLGGQDVGDLIRQ